MNGKCAYCGKNGEMQCYDCGIYFCCIDHQELYRYKPFMTDETYKADTTIDQIDVHGDGKEFIELKTSSSDYVFFGGPKVIVIQYRAFWHKQLCGFPDVKSAKEAWNRLKEKHSWKSWADINADRLQKPESIDEKVS